MSINGKLQGTFLSEGNCVYTLKDGVNDYWFGVYKTCRSSVDDDISAKAIAHAINMHDELLCSLKDAIMRLDELGVNIFELPCYQTMHDAVNNAP